MITLENYLKNCSSMRSDNSDIKTIITKFININNPPFKVIQVAGTNGKGTVSTLIAKYLYNLNINVGLFTSPHLIDVNERINFNGNDISDEQFSLLYKKYDLEQVKDKLTYFELLFLIAILYFKDTNAKFVVLETGLGGRLDATTIIDKDLAVITKIDLDHTNLLGNNIEEIAKEKAYIAKNAKKLIYLPQSKNVNEILSSFISKDNILDFNYYIKEPNNAFEVNFNIFYSVVKYLETFMGIKHEQSIIKKLLNFRVKGRVDLIRYKNRRLLLDVSHNVDGVKNLINELNNLNINKIDVVYSTLEDKDYKTILKLLKPKISKIFFYKISSKERNKKSPKDLNEYANSLKLNFDNITNLNDFIEQITEDTLFCGSFILIGEVYKILDSK